MLYHFFIASKYIMIKQSYFIDRLNKLIEKLRIPKKRNKTSFQKLYSEFRRINQHLAYQAKEIQGYNKFWSIHLSAQFVSNLFCIGYLAYCYIFIPATFDQRVYYIFFGTELSCLVFSVIYRCSVIDANNDLCYDRNVKICILFQLHFRTKPLIMSNVKYKCQFGLCSHLILLQIYTIATNRNFSKYCFRLKNSYR